MHVSQLFHVEFKEIKKSQTHYDIHAYDWVHVNFWPQLQNPFTDKMN